METLIDMRTIFPARNALNAGYRILDYRKIMSKQKWAALLLWPKI